LAKVQKRRFLVIYQPGTMAAMFVNHREEMNHLHRGPPIDASYRFGSFGQTVSEEKIQI